MAQADATYMLGPALWDFYYAPKFKARGYGGPAFSPPVSLPRRQRLAEPAGKVDPRLAMARRRIMRVEADILESERRCERRRLLDEFRYAADGTRLLLNRDGSRVAIMGQAVSFDRVSEKIDGHFEKFRRGALTWDHGCALVMGHGGPEVANTARGTLRIWNEKDGLKFSAVLADTPAARAAVNSARLANGASISFLKMEQARIGAVVEVRKAVLRKIVILSPPSQPAYPLSLVFVKSEPPPCVTP